jgi:dUTP pyrophosphatase
MKVEFKLKLHSKIPTKAYETDAAFDFYSSENITIQPNCGISVSTGVSMDIAPGYVGLLFSRSGMGAKGLRLSNCVGVIDSGYQGEISVLLHNDSAISYYVNMHDKIAQLMILRIPEIELVLVNEFGTNTARGDDGFGSTGQ